MKYIDVVVTTYSTDDKPDLDRILWPSHIAKILEDAGVVVRSTTVVDSETGLTGNYRSDKIQHKIDKARGK